MGNITFAERYHETVQPSRAAVSEKPAAQQAEQPAFDLDETIALLRRVGTQAESVSQAAEKLYTAIQSRAR
jgi:hypothetical protein